MKSRGMFVFTIATGLIAGGVAGLFTTFGRDTRAATEPGHACSTRSAETRAVDATSHEALLAQLDTRIEARRRHAERSDDWLDYELLAGLYAERARLSSDWGDYARADAALDTAFEHAPEGFGPWGMRASLEYTLHRFEGVTEALDHIESFAIQRPAERALVRTLRADVAFHSGRYEEARTAYETELESDRSVSTLVALAQYRWKTGDFAGAEALLTEARESSAQGSAGMRAWLALVCGLMETDREQWQAALTHYEAGLEALPGYWLLEEHAAEAMMELGRREEARAIYDRLIENTGDPEFMDQRALIAREDGDMAMFTHLRDEARRGHEARMEMFPEAAYGHALGHWMEVESDPARTVEIAEANYRARPGGEALTLLIEAYLAAGRRDDARTHAALLEATPFRTADATRLIAEARAQ